MLKTDQKQEIKSLMKQMKVANLNQTDEQLFKDLVTEQID